MNPLPFFLEACCTSLDEVRLAQTSGASRIELCEDLSCGGITPSLELLEAVLSEATVPVNVLVRPAPAVRDDSVAAFVLREEDKDLLIKQIAKCKEAGADGIVAGGLLPDGAVDVPLLRRIIATASPLPVTFHKAFDACPDPFKALEDLISAGCARILTSGCAPTALEGAERLTRLIRKAGDRIIIMPGGHIRPDNIPLIINRTNASEYHASAAFFIK